MKAPSVGSFGLVICVALGLASSLVSCGNQSGASNGTSSSGSAGVTTSGAGITGGGSGGGSAGGATAGGTSVPLGGYSGSSNAGPGGVNAGGAVGGAEAEQAGESGIPDNAAGASAGGSAGSAGSPASAGAAGHSSAFGITKDAEVKLTGAGFTSVSYGGFMNGESFQEEGIISFKGYQYTAFWNTARHVVLARRVLPRGTWSTLEFTDYVNTEDDAHNTISLGICPGDGTLHLSFDHHVSSLHYRKSVAGFLTNSSSVWAASSFSAVSNSLVSGTSVSSVTYPRFVTEPGDSKMLFEVRIGSSGSGDQYLWEYDASTHAWVSLGQYLNGTGNSINAYPHGLSYGKGSARLYISWCWRETPDATTNHDLLYAYSDDNGRTWKNDAGTAVGKTGSTFINLNSAGIKVWTIPQNRGLINTEHMAIDGVGRVHVLLSHMPDSQADDSNFDSARTKSQLFDYWRDTSGKWTRVAIGVAAVASFRGKLAISSTNNVYGVLPDLRIAAASPASNFTTWTVLDSTDAGRFFSDPVIDVTRLLTEDKLSVFYPQKSSPNIYVLDYTLR